MSKTVPNTAAANKAEITGLKRRVQELEGLVLSLKKRLEELRKAKSTTVLKKEKQYISTTNAKQRSASSRFDSTIEQQLEKLKIEHEKEIKEMQAKKPPEITCNHLEELSKLKRENESLEKKNQEIEELNEHLKDENDSLLRKFEELFMELSIKEAKWCEKEEELNLKLKLQWSEKYRDWMAATEAKIEELQAANDLLRRYVKPPTQN